MDKIKQIKDFFKDKSLYELALTHRSWINENKNAKHNERLEFLGDAVLEFIVSSFLFENFPNKEEGFLTAIRAKIVNTKNLAALAEKMNLGEYIKMSKGEEQGGGKKNDSLLADAVEALIGALYLDSGLESAKSFININLLKDIEKKLHEPLKDPKSTLQEIVQAKGLPTPRYFVINETGPDHDKTFTVEVYVGKETYGQGKGRSKNLAEQDAAKYALEKIKLK